MKVGFMSNPPIDFGIGIHDNFRVYKLSLVFTDLLINLREKSIMFGIGIPFIMAIVFYHINNDSTAEGN